MDSLIIGSSSSSSCSNGTDLFRSVDASSSLAQQEELDLIASTGRLKRLEAGYERKQKKCFPKKYDFLRGSLIFKKGPAAPSASPAATTATCSRPALPRRAAAAAAARRRWRWGSWWQTSWRWTTTTTLYPSRLENQIFA